MPRIKNLVPVAGGLGVVLDMPTSETGSVTILTEDEVELYRKQYETIAGMRLALDRLQSAANRLTDNLAEFGHVTDDVFIDDVERAGIAARAFLEIAKQ